LSLTETRAIHLLLTDITLVQNRFLQSEIERVPSYN